MKPINFPALPSTSTVNLFVGGDAVTDCKQATTKIVAGSSAKPVDKMTKALTKYNSVAVEKCSVAEVVSKDNVFQKSSVKNAQPQEMASESKAAESGSPDSVGLESIGFDLESEEIVKNLVAEIKAEQSIKVLLPDGWQMKDINGPSDKFMGMIIDGNEMPRISCVKKMSYYEKFIRVNILSYEYALTWKSDREATELNERFQKAAADELKSLMGESVFENFCLSDCVVRNPGMFCNHEAKLARHVKPVLEWGNKENNKKVVESFLIGKFKSSEAAIQLYKFIEMFAVNKDLLKVAQLCSNNTSICLHPDAVYDTWKFAKGIDANGSF